MSSLQQRGRVLLPWELTAEEVVQPKGAAAAAAATPPPLSLVDRLAAPTNFMHQALVFQQALDAGKLHSALAQALAQFPTLACRATQDEHGEWQLCQPGAGALLSLGTSAAPLRRLAPPPPLPPAAPLADLGAELFGHLEDASLAADTLPLLQVALVTLHGGDSGGEGSGTPGEGVAGGGCVLGLRASHLVADFGTLHGLLHHLAAAYSGRAPLGGAPQPAEPLVSALAAALPPAGSEPWNYLRPPPDFMAQFMQLVAAPPQHGLTLHFSAARLAALKAQAAAEAAAVEATEGGEAAEGVGGEPAWVSTNDALMAWLWKAFASLPCRQGAVTAFNQGLDMRGRLTPAGAPAAAPQPRWLYGNLATSAYTPALDAKALPLGAVARALRRTVASDAAKFGPDLAHVSGALAGGARCGQFVILPVLRIVEAAAAGRPAPVMVSQCRIDYEASADFGGQLPVMAVPTFGRMVIPIAHSQPAPPAAGGGVLVHLWLPEDQARELAAYATEAAAAGGEAQRDGQA